MTIKHSVVKIIDKHDFFQTKHIIFLLKNVKFVAILSNRVLGGEKFNWSWSLNTQGPGLSHFNYVLDCKTQKLPDK